MKQKLFYLLLFLTSLFWQTGIQAQTLQAGDIAFIGFNTDGPDGFAFIALKDLPAGESLYFTEEGWGDDEWGNEFEPHLQWVIPSGITVGTIVSVIETDINIFAVTGSSNGVAFLNPSGSASAFSLSAGDQMLAYQSSSGARPSSPTFISGVHADYNSTKYNTTTTWNTYDITNGGSESLMPPGLTNGVDALALFPAPGPELDNAKYNGTLSGTADDIRALINSPSSWVSNDSNPYDITPSAYSSPAISSPVNSNNSLSKGDLAVIGFNSDSSPDEMALVALADIPSGETVYITDYGWDGSALATSSTADGVITWNITNPLPGGTILNFTISNTEIIGNLTTYGSVSYSGWSNSNSAVVSGGDNWFIFQGTNDVTPTKFIFGWANWSTGNHGNYSWATTESISSTTSYLPSDLTNGTNAIALTGTGHSDNMVYTGASSGSKNMLLAAITNTTNWTGDEETVQELYPLGINFPGAFTIGVSNTPPTITTTAASQITPTTATVGGNVTDNGGATVTERGIVYNTTGTPTTADTNLQIGTGEGSFSKEITGLDPETIYFVRAYAINSEGTSYGDEASFTTTIDCTTPPDQDYGTYQDINYGQSLTYECVTYTGNNVYVGIGNTESEGISFSPLFSGSAAVIGANSGGGYASLKSASSTNNFKLVSFVADFYGHSNGNSSESFDLKGYDNSTEVVSVDGFNVTVSGTYGAGNAEITWVRNDYDKEGNNSGTLSFGPGWSNIDEIRFLPKDEAPNNYFFIGLDNVNFDPAVLNTAPTATNVFFTGDLEIGKKLTGNYTFSDTDNDSESGSTYQWYRSVDVEGTNKSVIQGANNADYTLSVDDAGNYISFEVIPNDGNTAGAAVASVFKGPVVNITIPVLASTSVSNVLGTTATFSGEVTNDGGSAITERGFVYNTSGTPKTSDNKIQSGTGIGAFSKEITTLTTNTTYYVRAYAINGAGTAYGAEQTFTTYKEPTFSTIPVTEVAYGNAYSYNIVASQEGDLETTLTATTLPHWLNFSIGGSGEPNHLATLLQRCYGIASDEAGNLYTITTNGTTIYKISPDGTVTTWKSGLASNSVYKLHIVSGYLYISKYNNSSNSITRIPLNNPEANEEIFAGSEAYGAFEMSDANNYLYVATIYNDAIIKINIDTKVIETLISSLDVHNPFGITYGHDNNIYITSSSGAILRYDGASLTTVLSNLPSNPYSIIQDNQGNFYLSLSNTIRKYTNDFSSYEEISTSVTVWNLTLTPSGNIAYIAGNNVYSLQAGAILSGTPDKAEVGDHEVVLKATNASGSTTQSFTINVVDKTGPVVQTFFPAHQASDVSLQPILSLMFDEEVRLGSSGTLTIEDQNGVVQTYDLAVQEDREKFSLSEDKLTLSLHIDKNLPVNTTLSVGISSGLVKDKYDNGFEAIEASNNTWTFTTINKLAQTITFPEISEKTYGDATFTLGNEKTDQGLTVTYTAQDPDIVSISGNLATILKSGTTEITATQEGDATHFAATPVAQTLTVNVAAITITADAKSKIYGEEDPELIYQVTTGALLGDDTFTGELSRETGENAGTYAIEQGTLALSSNYNLTYKSADLTIKKAEAVITANAVQTFTFDGSVKNVLAELNHLKTELTYAPQQGYSNAGTYPVTISAQATENYLSASKEVSLEIKNAEITGVTFASDSFVYDGTPHSIFVNGLPEDASVAYANNGQINAGTYQVTATVSQENFNDKVLTADLVIKKAEAVIAAEAVQTFTYDGSVKNVLAELNHLETELDYSPQQGYSNAGTYPITISAQATENYLSASKEVSLVIENAEITGVAFTTDSFIYDGTAHSIFVENLPQDAKVEYANNGQINAGTYQVTATVNQENFNDKVLTADLVIKKAEAVIATEAVQTFTYDGLVKNVAASLNHSETELVYTPQQGYSNAGTYPVTIYAQATKNYLSASKEVSLEIKNAEITGVTFASDSFVYDGTGHSIFVENLPQDASVAYVNNGQTNAGTYHVTATVSQKNFNDKVLTADLIIKKAEAVITAEAVQTFTYDGLVKNVAASLNHSETELDYSPQQGYSNAGTYEITVASEETDNYFSTSKEVSLVIENAEIKGVTFASDSFIYDGTAHSIFVENLPQDASVAYENNGQTNAGTYQVTATVTQENFNDQVLTADLIIKKAEAVITANAVQTFTYDGSVKNVLAELNHLETELTYAPQQGYSNAGTYPITISAQATENYLSASKEVSLEIRNAEITGVTFAAESFVYDGTPHSIFVDGLPEGASVSYDNNGQINAGIYKVTATVSQENFNDLELTADLVIHKAQAIITAEAVQTFTYDGSVKNVAASLNHSEATLTYTPQQGYSNAGAYPITIFSQETDNYLSASKEVSLVIENAEITGVTFASDSFVYDGTPHSIFVENLPQDAKVEYANNGQINAGTYQVTATVSQENFNDKVLTADLIIKKAEAVITAEAVQTFTYDGSVKNVLAQLNHLETELTYAPQQGYTNAGTYEIIVTSEETDNYLATSKEVLLVIENAEITGVTFASDSFVYDRTPHSIFVENLPQDAKVEYANNGQTNAGTYQVTATVTQENFNDQVLTADLIIKKAEAVIAAETVQTFTYDGLVKNVLAELNHLETELTYAPQKGYTNAGTYPVTISAQATENYLSASKEVSLVIENAEITGVTFASDSFVYDGTPHSIFVENLPTDASVAYANNGQINAGTYQVTATVSQENFNDKVLTADLVIKKAEAVIAAEAVQTFTYDGLVKNVLAELNHSEATLTYDPAQGYINAGTYEVTVDSEETDNYLATSKEVSIVIKNAEITGVTFTSESFVYDGTPHSIFVENLPQDAKVEYANNGQTNAGTYQVTATVSQENFNDKVLTADLVIKKAEAVIAAEAVQTFTYDGLVKNVLAELNHLETELTYAPQQGYSNAGTYEVTVASEETDNYFSTSKEVSLVIENAEITGVTFASDSFVYDGTPHSIFVENLPQDASVAYANNGQTNAGTYQVMATVTQENFNDKVLTADLVIKKALQSISFEELATKNLQNDADFFLNAASTSGLTVTYFYTSEEAEPAATVSENGFVSLLADGLITITARQPGNQNYEAAAPVSQMLKVESSEARLNSVVINGTSYSNPPTEIYYLIGCGSEESEVEILLETSRGSSADHTEAFTIETPVPGIYKETVRVTSGDGSASRMYNVMIEKAFNFEDIVVQKFNNVLLVNNNPETNGGYKFSSYQWFKNGSLMGNEQYFSEGDNASDQLESESSYYVEMTTEDGETLRTCSTVIRLKNSYKVILTPNPVNVGETLELFADFPKEELETMQLSIHNLNGALLKRMKANKKTTTIELPFNVQVGVYILSIETSKRSKMVNFIVR